MFKTYREFEEYVNYILNLSEILEFNKEYKWIGDSCRIECSGDLVIDIRWDQCSGRILFNNTDDFLLDYPVYEMDRRFVYVDNGLFNIICDKLSMDLELYHKKISNLFATDNFSLADKILMMIQDKHNSDFDNLFLNIKKLSCKLDKYIGKKVSELVLNDRWFNFLLDGVEIFRFRLDTDSCVCFDISDLPKLRSKHNDAKNAYIEVSELDNFLFEIMEYNTKKIQDVYLLHKGNKKCLIMR